MLSDEQVRAIARSHRESTERRRRAQAEEKFREKRKRSEAREAVEMKEIESYTHKMRRRGRYRIRTWLRGHAPGQLTQVFPKGARDCGSHEWYRQDEQTDACYHCEPGTRPHEPLDIPVDLEFRAGLIESAAQGDKAAAAALAQLEANDRELGRLSPRTGALR